MDQHYDVVFRIDAQLTEDQDNFIELKSHKVILANQSEVFNQMFYGPDAEDVVETDPAGFQVVRITDISPHIFLYMLLATYDKAAEMNLTELIMTEENFKEIDYVVKKYKMEPLRSRFINGMLRKLTDKNALVFWSLSRKYGFESCAPWVCDHIMSFLDISLNPEVCPYLTSELWDIIINKAVWPRTNLQNLLNIAILWASKALGDTCTIDEIRTKLEPIETLLIERYPSNSVGATITRNNAHYEVIFPRIANVCRNAALVQQQPQRAPVYPLQHQVIYDPHHEQQQQQQQQPANQDPMSAMQFPQPDADALRAVVQGFPTEVVQAAVNVAMGYKRRINR